MLEVNPVTGQPRLTHDFEDAAQVNYMTASFFRVIDMLSEHPEFDWKKDSAGIFFINQLLQSLSPTVEERKVLHEANRKAQRDKIINMYPGLANEK